MLKTSCNPSNRYASPSSTNHGTPEWQPSRSSSLLEVTLPYLHRQDKLSSYLRLVKDVFRSSAGDILNGIRFDMETHLWWLKMTQLASLDGVRAEHVAFFHHMFPRSSGTRVTSFKLHVLGS